MAGAAIIAVGGMPLRDMAAAGASWWTGVSFVTLAQLPTSHAEIQRVVDEVVRRFWPLRVVLFGSYAYGQPTSDSDVDLLVTMETPLRAVDQAVAIRDAVEFPFPTDLLVRTPRQIEERLAMGDPFLKEVLARGVVLYEAAD